MESAVSKSVAFIAVLLHPFDSAPTSSDSGMADAPPRLYSRTGTIQLLSTDLTGPNGIPFSPDEEEGRHVRRRES
jgi:hypothetical protein